MRTWSVLLLIAAVTTLPANPAHATERNNVWDRTYEITGKPALVLDSDDFSIHVSTWDRKAIGVHIEHHGWSWGPSSQGLRVQSSQSGDQIRVTVREPGSWIGFHSSTALIEVQVPAEVDLDIRTSDGRVEIAPVTGRVAVQSSDGSVVLQGVHGDTHVRTSDGSIDAKGMDGRLYASTDDGSIRVKGRFDTLELRTGDGRIFADAAKGSAMRESWMLESSDGPLTLRIPPDLDADLDARTGDGRIAFDLPVTVSGSMNRRDVHGRLNRGGPPLRLRTSDGSIRIERSN